ncbi:hypothetical protein JK386_06275 [Nocardioides sp. zg-536]|uniref:Polysaccharide chain length determinant N-terminal domain-containing protein n=1 Tax=Nocardioides faecalis TaxID=2803858 RepID=A0A938Y5B4_9ACTN|nr:hypothetical protein [Nocardioides faecalis]MBM9459502.1 hypothetical protein [Nocardioides faecalis]MBS4753718.1 hypothetical protein [Nocardioides faecalis]QVI58040.1 hypothetical protein KG111_13570 [Nocardioides faecalis]
MTSTATPLTAAATAAPRPGGLRALPALLWRRRWAVLLVIAVVAGTVGLGLATAERHYTATARVAATPAPAASSSAANYEDLLGTMARVATSGPLLEQVARSTGALDVEQLRDRVEGEVVAGTVIIQVAVTDVDPERAALVANAVANELPEHDPSEGAFVFSVTEPAEVPEEASSPDIPVTVLAGMALALGLALAVAVLLDRTFRTVDTPQEVLEATGATVLGVLPQPSDPVGMPATRPRTPETGAFRALRLGVEFASTHQPTRLLVVAPGVGSDPHPGWVEANLAAALADVGHRVLLIDGDRDTPRRHPVLDRDGDPGLYDVLAGSVPLLDAVHPEIEAGFDVLGLGAAHLAPPSLLEMRFRELLEQTEAHYDVVVVHAAAVSVSEDARIMAIHGALLLTVSAGRVNPRHLERVAEHLRMVDTRVLGAVLRDGSRAPAPRVRRTTTGA